MSIETFAGLALRGGHDILAMPEQQRSLADARPGSWLYDTLTMGTPTYTGRSVSPQSAMAYSAVYACVAIRAQAVASCPLVTFRSLLGRAGAGSPTKVPAVDDYRYRMLLEQPNPEMSAYGWIETASAHVDLWGNHYSWLDWDSRGHLRGIWPMRPDWVIPMRNASHRLIYRYSPLDWFNSPVPGGEFEDWQVLHIPGMGFDGVMGLSPIGMQRQAIGIGMAYQEFGGRFFANNAKPNLLLSTPGRIDDPEQVRREWNKQYGGLDNVAKVGVLHGAWKVDQFSINPVDAQFMEGQQWQLAEVARCFQVPLQMLADWMGKTSTYASAEQFDRNFTKHTIRPICKRFEGKINITVLGSQASLTCAFDTSELEEGDAKTQQETTCGYVQGSILTPNEGRARVGMNPSTDPNADKLYGQMQDVPLGTQPKPATPAAQGEPK